MSLHRTYAVKYAYRENGSTTAAIQSDTVYITVPYSPFDNRADIVNNMVPTARILPFGDNGCEFACSLSRTNKGTDTLFVAPGRVVSPNDNKILELFRLYNEYMKNTFPELFNTEKEVV